MSSLRRISAFAAIGLAATALVGCSTTVALKPAPDANNPLCANVMVNLPDTIASNDPNDLLERQWTDAQSTASWGPSTTIRMWCGVEVPTASELPCQSIAGFDWIIDESESPYYRVTTFGREPALQLVINGTVVSATDVLTRIGKAAQDLPKTGACSERPE